MEDSLPLTVLHYTGYENDRGGIVTNIRHLAGTGAFRCLLGVSPRFSPAAALELEPMILPGMNGETIDAANFWRARRVGAAAGRWLQEDRGRIFHGHSRAGLLTALWLRAMGHTRVIASVHCYGRQRWFYRAASALLAGRLRWLTPAMRRYYFGGDSRGWEGCVPNCIVEEPASAMRVWPGARALRLAGAGQLTSNKRWDLVLRALARLPRDIAIDYTHAGGPTRDRASVAHEQELRALAREAGVVDRVRWLGWQENLAGLLAQADVVVVPNKHEAFSFVALEAWHAGVPVIAARGGGPDDLVVEGRNGWFFDGDKPDSLAALLLSLLRREHWSGLEMRREELARFSAVRVAAQWAEIYRQL